MDRLLAAAALSLSLGASAQTLEEALPAALVKARAAAAAPRPAAPKEPSNKTIPRFQQRRFPAPSGGACGLKTFTVEDYEARMYDPAPERARVTVVGSVVETTSPDCVRDYAVVQFIRGCAYHERYSLADGALIERTFDVARRLRGPRVVFSHPDFEVDNTGLDPLYAAEPGEADRLALLYVPKSPLRLRSDAASLMADLKAFDRPDARVFLADAEGPTAVTFVTDGPDGGVSMVDEARTTLSVENASLDFKTCVYRVKDIPTTGDPAGPDASPERGGPLACFSWMSRYNWDPAAQDFVTDKYRGVDPFCAQAPARAPLPGS
ncbi:MAG: hypothetical protein HY079_01375 [Elusimicrobia bacterium]|nr:hypothetical protein [Elusimicrobiota bacterium]